VLPGDVAALAARPAFMAAFRTGLRLLAASYGWDLGSASDIPAKQRKRAQRWSNWPIRLWKATRSAMLFGADAEAASLVVLGRRLIGQGHEFRYGGQDLAPLFMDGHLPADGEGAVGKQ
jgi:hypothetical protein